MPLRSREVERTEARDLTRALRLSWSLPVVARTVGYGVSLGPMKRGLYPTFLAVAVGLSALLESGAASADVSIPFTRSTLPNGMTVILHENHDVPLVVV